MDKPLLVITFPNHWSIKNLIHTGALGLLQQTFRIEAWCDESKILALQDVANSFCIDEIIWRANIDYRETGKHKFWRLIQKSLLFERRRVSTEQIVKKSHRGKRSVFQKFSSSVVKLVAISPFGERTLKYASELRESSIPSKLISFSELPCAVFASNPVDFHEDPLVLAATVLGVPTITMIPSWDNLSNKGVLLSYFHTIFVWNETMKSELLSLYPVYELAEVTPIGVPRFDIHESSPNGEFERGRLLVSLGLDPSKSTILYANTATSSFPQQPQVIAHLIEGCENGIFQNCQVLIRCHPHDDISKYERFNRQRIAAVWPPLDEAKNAFGVSTCPPADDLLRLSAMIQACDVIVNAASTIVLDAACCDKPIISIAYDGDESPSYYDSIESAYKYTHQVPFLESGAGVIARSKSELHQMVNNALINPFELQNERKALKDSVCCGSSVQNLVRALEKFAN